MQALIWGAAKPGTVVRTTFKDEVLTTAADARGVWRQKLPATAASPKAHSIVVVAARP